MVDPLDFHSNRKRLIHFKINTITTLQNQCTIVLLSLRLIIVEYNFRSEIIEITRILFFQWNHRGGSILMQYIDSK